MITMHRNQFLAIFTSVTVCLLIGVNPALCGDYTNYRLLPGSTFTPKYQSQITGPAEDLTGSFQWHYEYQDMGYEVFKITSLHFESDSYTLNLSANNNEYSTVKDNSDLAIFLVDVDITGRPITEATLNGGGTYSGPSTSPTYLSYPAVDLYPDGGGYYYGCLTLYAEQIPEPATFLILGLGGLALRRKR